MFIVFGKKAFYAIFALLLVLTVATVSMLLPPEAVETSVSAPTGKTVWVIDELGLYLTTHPEDTEVLNLYWSYIKLGREGREAYEKQYGPILQTDVTPGSFKWLNDPWPWDLEGEK